MYSFALVDLNMLVSTLTNLNKQTKETPKKLVQTGSSKAFLGHFRHTDYHSFSHPLSDQSL